MPKPKAPHSGRFNIEITEKDITKAKANDSYKCVVAQAVARTIPDAMRIEVDTQTIRMTRSGDRIVYLTPYAVQGYVIAFDAGDKIQPFSFQLRDPIKTRHQAFTETGKKVTRVRQRARRAVVKKARDAGKLLTPAVKEEAAEAAKAAYHDAIAAHPGEQIKQMTGDGRRTPPSVFKRKERSYGHRLLRINQKAAAAPPAVQ